MATDSPSAREQVTIFLHSGSYDRVTNALSLAIICLAMDMEVHILLTYQALRRFVKGHLDNMDETDSEFQVMFQRGEASGQITPIGGKLTEAKELGLRLYACTNAMTNMNIARQNLVEEVDEVIGLATFVGLARKAVINWYI